MLVDDVSKVNHELIGAAASSVTYDTMVHKANTFVMGPHRMSATYYVTIGFNARDIDST